MTASSTTTNNNNNTDQLVSIPQNNISKVDTNNNNEDGFFDKKVEGDDQSCCSKMVMIKECRICQDEDQEHELESPCACNGTLKFAHRKCIQKWCNKKGDITCEICNQVYSPDYTLPPTRINPDVMTIDIRHAWGPQMNLRDAHFLAFASGEQRFLEPDYEEFDVASNSSIAYLRYMALILMIILLVRQALLVTRDLGMVTQSSKIFKFQVSVLQLAGFLLPCYVVSRSWLMILRHRRRQV
ncbi:zinc finger, RING-CH-type, Zinc finger, RING/FYVE/PHD-type [Artemisia annua]|uniref:Zinc finger, RING-CH-type, Zinc finger, RING/FYVE/PHD-type n=1 Tax=Artemisia annua TaxID=35608 RepID=A0A2U1KJ40_ARTAN|nr:zinc finger, RING-CH-type, Zinc finger, RING/FYVE/PHD-type [Artemisia annua]